MPDPNRYTWEAGDLDFENPGDEDAAIIEFDGDEDADTEPVTPPDAKAAPPAGEIVGYDAWADYDTLKDDIGDVWLNGYQQQVLALILSSIDDSGLNDAALDTALTTAQQELVTAWTGTDAAPGPLSRLLLAGAAAGDASLRHHSAANPNRPMALKAAQKSIELGFNWNLANVEAIDFIQRYALNLITRLNDTTRREVREAITKWLETGGTQAELQQMIQQIVLSSVRARAISTTESTRAYSEGAQERYRQAGVKKVQWRTVNVGLKRVDKQRGDVCAICGELHDQMGEVGKGVYSKKLGRYVLPPAHVGCRCWTVAADEDML